MEKTAERCLAPNVISCGTLTACLNRNGRTTGVKRKLGVRDRLARKLLSGRAAAATAGELAAADAESHRDRMSNRWEEV